MTSSHTIRRVSRWRENRISTDELLGRSAIKYPEHQPQFMVAHDAPPKKVIAKLRGQVQNL